MLVKMPAKMPAKIPAKMVTSVPVTRFASAFFGDTTQI